MTIGADQGKVEADPRHVAGDLFGALEAAWNAADGSAYGAPFTVDADFVDIRSEHHAGVETIGRGHQAIFDTIYRGSTMSYAVTDARVLADACVLAHAVATLDSPTSPLQGIARSRLTIVAVPEGPDRRIAAAHNTLLTA